MLLFDQAFRATRGRKALRLREDFCGTFRLSAEWVKQSKEHRALGLDIDPEPLHYGRRNHYRELRPSQRSRLSVRKQNVLMPTRQTSDVIAACNFSLYTFKSRELLLKYFKSCLKSLASDGVLILEMAGGPGMIAKMRERKTVRAPQLRIPGKKFTYVWEQKDFDPITHDALYYIHFKLNDGRELKQAFEYDWRLWTIPEVRDILVEAGFSSSRVYWESEHKGVGTGEYVEAKRGDNAYSWIAYVVGVK